MSMHGHDYRVVGIFGDVRDRGLAEEPGDLMIQPWGQGAPAAFAVLGRGGARSVVQCAP